MGQNPILLILALLCVYLFLIQRMPLTYKQIQTIINKFKQFCVIIILQNIAKAVAMNNGIKIEYSLQFPTKKNFQLKQLKASYYKFLMQQRLPIKIF